MSNRPEHSAPPEIYYGEEESKRYNTNSHILKVQSEMSERALEMLLLPEDECSLVLDVGCGTGISSYVLSNSNNFWVGLDISRFMLYECMNNVKDGDMILCDIGETMNFRPNLFDGCISVSVIQWLFVSNNKLHDPYSRLCNFFKWLYKSLNYNARACLQFYPENPEQVEMLLSVVKRCNFNGGLVVDYPNSVKNKKYYLCIWPYNSSIYYKLPESIDVPDEEPETVYTERNELGRRKKRKNKSLNYKERIINKKQQQRVKGYMNVRPDSKYTGRKRPSAF